MANIQVGRSSYNRAVAAEPTIVLRNRFFEQNPVLNASDDFPALIARPAMRKFAEVGSGHIRKVFSEPGTFDDDVFVVSAGTLYRIDRETGASSTIGVVSTNTSYGVSMAATGNIETVPEYLFIADGGVLWVYSENGSAIGHLEATGAIANGDVVEIGGVYYEFTNGSVDSGTPAGTVGNPWLVAFSGTNATDIQSLFYAINGTGTPGTTYSTDLTAHATVSGTEYDAADLYVAAKEAGTAGNSITTTGTGANLAWASGTLTGGGSASLRQIAMPDDVGAISVATINGYVIVVPAQGMGVNGRFYWIDPGETYVDPLNFATAERSPDPAHQVIVFSDRFWLCGATTTEPWVTTGNLSAPMQRFTGILYDRGTWAGTAVKVKDTLILVDPDGPVFQIGNGIKEISRPDIAERIRKAIAMQAIGT